MSEFFIASSLFLSTSSWSFVLSTGVASPSADSLSLASFAFAVTFSPALILSFGSVTAPVASSIFIEVSVPAGSVHFPSSPFVATSVWSCPSLSLYAIVTLFVSASVGGVTFTLPLSSTFTAGFSGAVVSFELAVASGDTCSSAFSFAFTSLFLDSMLAGIVTVPVSSSILIFLSVPSASFHLPSAPFFAVTFVAGSPNDISSVSDSLLLGNTFTLPSSTASTVGALSFSRTVSACESCPTFWLSPVPCVTVTAPSSATSILASCGKFWFAFLTSAITLSFSACVNCVLSTTSVFAGATSLIVLSASVDCSIVWSGWNVPILPSPIGTVTVPLGSTWISSSVNPSSGLAFLISSLTACFSCSVSLLVSPTFTLFAGGFNVLPSLVNGFTVSLPSSLPVLVPFVTVTLPLLSTSIFAVSGNEFFSLTAAATLSLSAFVKSVVSFTSVFSGAVKSSIVSFCTTVWSGVNEPTLPSWLIFTDPSSFTVMSSFVKFLSGFAALIASLTACFSVSVNAFALSTLTGSFGGLKLFWTSFCLTVFSGANVPVLPFFVTVTVPSSATVTSASVIPLSLFASATAFFTLSISSDVKDLVFFTSTGVGSVNFNSSVAFFSQTAYTVLGALTLFKMLASASVAFLSAAQPLNVYPSLVGSAGFVTFSPSTLTLVVSLSSANLPWFASKVTVSSSE